MARKKTFSWTGHIFLYFVLSTFFSTIPLSSALVFDKSSLGLAWINIWYTSLIPVYLFFISWLIYGREPGGFTFISKAWTGIGVWYLVQVAFSVFASTSLTLKLFALPTIFSGSWGDRIGMVVFLIGGFFFSISSSDSTNSHCSFKRLHRSSISTIIFLVACLLFMPLAIIYSSSLKDSQFKNASIPSEKEIFGYIENVFYCGERRPGSQGDLRAVSYLQKQLRQFGFQNVVTEPYRFHYWEAKTHGLSIQTKEGDQKVSSFYVPYSGPTTPGGITKEIVYGGSGTEMDLSNINLNDKILLVDLHAPNLKWSEMKLFSYLAYDPENTTKDWEHPNPIGWMQEFVKIYERAERLNVAGIVGILNDYPDFGEFTYYAPYDGKFRKIPSLYINEKDGKTLKKRLKQRSTTATLELTANIRKNGGLTYTVYAILPGQSKSNFIIHSHHDSPWRSGVGDSSGVGIVLGLARYFSELPLGKRDRTLIFLFTGSHMAGSQSTKHFIKKHKEKLFDDTLYDITIEHVALDTEPSIQQNGLPEPQSIFISENPFVATTMGSLIKRHHNTRTLLFPTHSPYGVPTDGSSFWNEDINIINYITSPIWLFDKSDTLDKVARNRLVPLTKMYIDLIYQLNRYSDVFLTLNLNIWTIVFIILVLSPLSMWNMPKVKY